MGNTLRVKIRDRWYTVEVVDLESNPARVLVDGELVEVDIDALPSVEAARTTNGHQPASAPAPEKPPADAPPADVKVVSAPLPGIIVSVSVSEGDQIAAGDEVCILEAMKMQQGIRSEHEGRVVKVLVRQGQNVAGGGPIVEIAS